MRIAIVIGLLLASLCGAAMAQDAAPTAAPAEPRPRPTIVEPVGPMPAVVTSDIALAPAPATAPSSAPMAPPTASSDAIVDQVVKDVQSGNWRYAAAGALSLLMIALQRARAKVKWFAGQRGGALLVGMLALAGALVTVLASSVPLSPSVFTGAAGIALTAVGGWHWVRDLVVPDKGDPS